MKANRNSARGEPRRLGNVAVLSFMLGSLLLLSVVRARFSPLAGKSHGSILAKQVDEKSLGVIKVEADMANDSVEDDEDAASRSAAGATADAVESAGASHEGVDSAADVAGGGGGGDGGGQAEQSVNKPVCYETSRRSDTCEAAGDVRVHGAAQTVFISGLTREWKTKPYCRKHDPFASAHVKEWTLKPLDGGNETWSSSSPPSCSVNSSATAFVISTGGFTGNPFHDYTDVLIPVFITSRQFHGDVQFLVSSHKSWWIAKYALIFEQLSKHEVIDIDGDGDDVIRCFPRVVVGPTFHKELGIDAGKTPGRYGMAEFKKMLRDAFGLERAAAAPSGDQWDIRRRPRLLIISRKGSRAFLNERAMADMAMSLGFDVRVGTPDVNTDVSKFSRLVNSADVMVGVHGAGLTNAVFLPEGAVLIQVVPFGGLEWLARSTFKEPAEEMGIHYLEYMIQIDETTLTEQYPPDHPVLKDPYSIHRQGWDALKTAYLDKQNVRPHLGRLKNTFLEALKLLPHGRPE